MRLWLERRMNDEAGPKDGAAPELERVAGRGLTIDAVPAPDGPAGTPKALDPSKARREEIDAVLGAKVLYAFLRNRMQIAYPLTLSLEALTEAEVALLMEVAVAAASAGGRPGRSGVREALAPARPHPRHLDMLAQIRESPERPLGALADHLRAAGVAPHAYAVAVMVLSRPAAVEQAFLTYLAARLGLRADVVEGVNRRYRR